MQYEQALFLFFFFSEQTEAMNQNYLQHIKQHQLNIDNETSLTYRELKKLMRDKHAVNGHLRWNNYTYD